MIDVHIVGMRDLRGRFTRMVDGELMEYQRAQSEELSREVQQLYKDRWESARKRPHVEGKDGRPPFAESFQSEARVTEGGFEIALRTDQGQLAEWIKKGTAPHIIEPKNANVLVFEGADGTVFAKRVHHPGTAPSDWQERAEEEARPLLEERGNKIGSFVVNRLGGKVSGE